ncbi:MAG: tRNA (adenosine(37)-N6)-threonylcarbamoyltransferase complex transferase subunit TsaD [Pelovirga sp.]
MLLLALESSCDETAAAVVRDGREVLSNIISSQIDLHSIYGGVVPELASRRHLEVINPLVEEALQQAGVGAADLEGVAVTSGPGLTGALLVGVSFAKAFAYALGIPFIGVHHIEAHIQAIRLEQEVAYPFLGAAISGGHTHLYRVNGIGSYQLLGRTIDDAAGEAFDKVAKMLGLGYPGGPVVDKLAADHDAGQLKFPRPLINRDNHDFSFSGMKTAVLNYIQKLPQPLSEQQTGQVASAFQEAVVEVLTTKILRAAEHEALERIVVAGGVACNSGLRKRFAELTAAAATSVYFPRPLLCADNAAMIAVAADYYLSRGKFSGYELNAVSSWSLEQVSLD